MEIPDGPPWPEVTISGHQYHLVDDMPPMALTAEQQIVLRCMEIVGPDISPAAHSPKGRKLFRTTVDELIARVTIGTWPDETDCEVT